MLAVESRVIPPDALVTTWVVSLEIPWAAAIVSSGQNRFELVIAGPLDWRTTKTQGRRFAPAFSFLDSLG